MGFFFFSSASENKMPGKSVKMEVQKREGKNENQK
jgi:hypothetical protein